MAGERGFLGGGRFEPIELTATIRPHVGKVTEWDVETALMARLGGGGGLGRLVERQRACHDGKPDITITWGNILTIVELKWTVDQRALNQLTWYVNHALGHRRDDAGRSTVFGILAGTRIADDLELPRWCAFQPLIVHVQAAA